MKRKIEASETLPAKRIASPICNRYNKYVKIKSDWIDETKVFNARIKELQTISQSLTKKLSNLKKRQQQKKQTITQKEIKSISKQLDDIKAEHVKAQEDYNGLSDRMQQELNKIPHTCKHDWLTMTKKRFALTHNLITIETAKELLFGNRLDFNGCDITAEKLFTNVKEVWYDYHFYHKERLLWLDPYDYICEIAVKPYVNTRLYMQRHIPEDFWGANDTKHYWNLLAECYYTNKYAYQVIRKAMEPWLAKPVTNDGKDGIYARIGYRQAIECVADKVAVNNNQVAVTSTVGAEESV